jgi:hypothetical protein
MTDKKIVHPVFLELSKKIEDPFWKSIFENISFGKMNNHFYISGNTVYSTNKKKMFVYTIDPTQDQNLVAGELCRLFAENTNIFSSRDNDVKMKLLETRRGMSMVIEDTWSAIKKKNTKTLLLMNYINDMRIEHRFDWKTARELYNEIQLSLIFKTHSSENIIISDGKIVEIEGISYDDKNGKFENEFRDKDVSYPQTEETVGDYLALYWDKYVKQINKLL